jgi:hypothetical protein
VTARSVDPATVVRSPVIVEWLGTGDDTTRRGVEAAVTAGVRRALAATGAGRPGRAGPGGAVPGDGTETPWAADAEASWWAVPSYDAGGATVAVPVRQSPGAGSAGEDLPRGDRLVRAPFPRHAVLRISVGEWIWTGTDAHVTSPSLARAVQWGAGLYGGQGFTVLERRDDHLTGRFVTVPLAEQLLLRQFGRSLPAPAGATESAPGLRVTERGAVVPLARHRVVMTATGDGTYVYDLSPRARWSPAAVRGELARTPVTERLDPAVAARVATAQLTAAVTGAPPGTPDEEAMLAHIVTMDRAIFAVMPWEQRAEFLITLSRLYWPNARQKRAIVELVASARSRTQLEAMAAVLRENGAYERLFTTLDSTVLDLLLLLGRARPPGPMSPQFVVALFRELDLLPPVGEGAEFPDPVRRLRNAASGASLWGRSTIEGIGELFTHSPAELIEGIGHLVEFAVVIDRATSLPPDPKALLLLVELAQQAGVGIRTAMAGLEYAEQLGTPYGRRGGGARIAGDLAQVLRTALAVEILSWFVGLGEVRAAVAGVRLSERVAALTRTLSSLRRLGAAAEVVSEVGRFDRLFVALVRLAGLRDGVAAARALRLLPQQHLVELVRLAELLEVPVGASPRILRAAADAKNALPEVQRLADALALARRFDRRATAVAASTGDLSAGVHRLLETGWDRRTLAALVDAVPPQRLGEWARALGMLRPDQIDRLGARSLEALAYWPRTLTFVAEAGGDVYLTMLQRFGGEHRAVEDLLHALELRRSSITGPAEYQRLLDRLAGGEAAAVDELAAQLSDAARTAMDRLRTGGRRQLLEELAEFEEAAARLRREGRGSAAVRRLADRDGLAARLGELSDRELDGLEHLARISEDTGALDWAAALDLPGTDRADLLVLVDDLAGRLPADRLTGIDEVLAAVLQRRVTKAGRLELAVQGGWGELYAARTLIEDLGATGLEFQASRPGRVVDILADLPGRGRVSVEVKTNLAGAASFVEEQIGKDLVAHAASGYTDLLYLYHPSVAAELPAVGQRMLQLFDTPELAAALTAAGRDPAAAKAAFQTWLGAGNPRSYRL